MTFIRGKAIISGEHSVVYGKPALVSSIDLGVSVKVRKGTFVTPKEDKMGLIKRAIKVAGGDNNIDVEINSELLVGAGMGSSAAISVATIKSVREYLGRPIGNDELFELAMECERIAHKNPSGVDPAAVIYGGLIKFVKGQGFERLVIKMPVNVLLFNSGLPAETTGEMVELVAEKECKDKIIQEIAKVTGKVKEILTTGGEIKEVINENGRLLEELGGVGERALKLSRALRIAGYGVKIAGAGGVKTGSGMMLVAGEDFAQAKKMLDNMQIDYFETVIGDR